MLCTLLRMHDIFEQFIWLQRSDIVVTSICLVLLAQICGIIASLTLLAEVLPILLMSVWGAHGHIPAPHRGNHVEVTLVLLRGLRNFIATLKSWSNWPLGSTVEVGHGEVQATLGARHGRRWNSDLFEMRHIIVTHGVRLDLIEALVQRVKIRHTSICVATAPVFLAARQLDRTSLKGSLLGKWVFEHALVVI